MKSKSIRPVWSISDAVYTAINQLDGGSEQQVMKRASKLCGKAVTLVRFKRALGSFDDRGVARAPSKGITAASRGRTPKRGPQARR